MKFSCGRCGKRYATAEAPAPGRVYKIKCKGCGHVIVVKASAGAPPSAGTEMRPPTSLGLPAVNAAKPSAKPQRPAAIPDLDLDLGPLEATDRADSSGSRPNEQRLRPGGASESATSADRGGRASPHGDSGYVDLFAETPSGDERAAARPEGLEPVAGHAPTTTPSIPFIPKPPQQKSAAPLLLIGAGGLVIVGILAFVLLRGRAPFQALPYPAQAPAATAQSQAPAATPQQPPAAVPQKPAALSPLPSQPPAPPPSVAAPPQSLNGDRSPREERRQRDHETKAAREKR